MNEIMELLQSLVPENFNMETFLNAALVLCIGSLVLGFLGRLVFGKKSVLNQSVSSTIGILFIYAVTIVIYSYGIDLKFLVSPLPFVTISGEYLSLFNLMGADYVAICGQLLDTVILAFLVNLVNSWMPKGKKLLGWLFFRCLSVVIAMLLYAIVNNLLTAFLPDGLLVWAPVILLGLLVVMLLVGALKFVVGAVLTTVNPLIAFLYTFFFANVVGKMLSKAMLTALLVSCLVYALNYIGVAGIFIGAAALAAYIPLLIVLLVLWYVIGHLL